MISFVLQWFICLFTNTNLSRNVRRCIFDHFLLEGLPAFIKAALCFFDVIEPAIQGTTLLCNNKDIQRNSIQLWKELSVPSKIFNILKKDLMTLTSADQYSSSFSLKWLFLHKREGRGNSSESVIVDGLSVFKQ